MLPPLSPQKIIDKTIREEWGRILASLVKSVGDIQLAEDCLQDACLVALEKWNKGPMPKSPAAWLLTAARRKAIDRLRRNANFSSKQEEIAYLSELEAQDMESADPNQIPDKRLEMIFTCCHPALEEKTRVALTLRTLCGLTTEEIAMAFLDQGGAMQQRLTRAKRKISGAGIPYKIPDIGELPDRLKGVLRVIYLVFNEGYAAHRGEQITRTDLSQEAIRLGRIIAQLMPRETEVKGLLALMLLHDSRRNSRQDGDGNMISLEHQNRARWNQAFVDEGIAILEEILPLGRLGAYQIQAAISAVHAQSKRWEDTNWQEIVALYDILYRLEPSAVVRLNQAVALSYAGNMGCALEFLNQVEDQLSAYQPYYAARADLCSRSGNPKEARSAYLKAISMSENEKERAFLQKKLDALDANNSA